MTYALHQASCVAMAMRGKQRAVLIEGPPGSGKSSLALALIDRGAVLVGDDGVRLERRDDILWASPAPNIVGMLEIRNVGIARFPVAEAPVGLAIVLDRDAPRLPDAPQQVERAGFRIPRIALDPSMPVLALRAEQALLLYGLR